MIISCLLDRLECLNVAANIAAMGRRKFLPDNYHVLIGRPNLFLDEGLQTGQIISEGTSASGQIRLL